MSYDHLDGPEIDDNLTPEVPTTVNLKREFTIMDGDWKAIFTIDDDTHKVHVIIRYKKTVMLQSSMTFLPLDTSAFMDWIIPLRNVINTLHRLAITQVK